jgi:hypothetical protein
VGVWWPGGKGGEGIVGTKVNTAEGDVVAADTTAGVKGVAYGVCAYATTKVKRNRVLGRLRNQRRGAETVLGNGG